MFTSNPFAELSASISPIVMQTYVVVMALLVVGGTVYDTLHKKSAQYFFANWRKAQNKGARQVGGGEMVSLAIQTAPAGPQPRSVAAPWPWACRTWIINDIAFQGRATMRAGGGASDTWQPRAGIFRGRHVDNHWLTLG